MQSRISNHLYRLPAFLLLGLSLACSLPVFSQVRVQAVVADSSTRQILSFATIRSGDGKQAAISGLNGLFNISLPQATGAIIVSYTGYVSRTINAGTLTGNDTIWLVPRSNTLEEVVIRPGNDKIKRIINTAIRNKALHNPDLYNNYQCNVYYRMYADAVPPARVKRDSSLKPKPVKPKRKLSPSDSALAKMLRSSHLVFSEVFSRRSYRQPKQLNELVLASRFSGFKKTYFASLVTDVLPFHIYSDYIQLNNTGYISPLAKGWEQRYRFRLEDEFTDGADTIFILSYRMKNKGAFNGLEGMLYINSDGYAVSHFTGSEVNILTGRQLKIEQLYTRVQSKWFPKEINYNLSFSKIMASPVGLVVNGHSVIDSVSFEQQIKTNADKAYSVRLSDSVDLRTEAYWQQQRKDTLGKKEQNTYRLMDSLFRKAKIEKRMTAFASLPTGRLALGKVDINLARLLTSNDFEGTRVGLGLQTNDKVSKYFAVGGWAGYGTGDKQWKYGLSATVFSKGNKDNWLRFAYSKDYNNAGTVKIHPALDRNFLASLLLQQPDRVEEYAAAVHTQRGYWEIEMCAAAQRLTALYNNNFDYAGKNISQFEVQEASIRLRYAYGEKRIPFFGNYLPGVGNTGYPVLYVTAAGGNIRAASYATGYLRAHIGITYAKHINRWGTDDWTLTAGGIYTGGNQPLSKSFLFAGNGYRRQSVSFYAPGGFITMRPYDVYSDKYISLLYAHHFDKYLWRNKYSQPFISVAHNMLYGSLSRRNALATKGIIASGSGYHESGLLLNRILQTSLFRLFTIYVNAGAFYHWAKNSSWQQNGNWVVGMGASF
jgi:hypothetical protein